MEAKQILLTRIIPSRWQPRGEAFDEERLWGLACSIRENGLINPVVVFPVALAEDDPEPWYELVAGERRTRAVAGLSWARVDGGMAAKAAVEMLARDGLAALPDEARALLEATVASIAAKVEPAADLERLHRIAVVENLERESLSPLEEAKALHDLAEEYDWSQRELARRIGKSQSYVASRYALLGLSEEAREAVSTRALTATHARAIARVPQELQGAVTGWATTRQVQNRARQLAAFVDPDRWLPNEETIYFPSSRNRLALMRWALEQADLEQCAGALLALASEGYNKSNWLAKKPILLVQSDYGLSYALMALGRPSLVSTAWAQFAEEAGRTCETCILAGTMLEDRAQLSEHCERWRNPDTTTCQGWIGAGVEDPLVIPLRHELENWFETLEIEFEREPFAHVTGIAPYVTGCTLAAHRKREQQKQQLQKQATKHVDEIRAFMDWQAQQPTEWLADFQAHACIECVHYREDLEVACLFAVEPLSQRYNSDPRSPEFGVLVSETGQMLPRCEQFAYREIPGIYGHEGMQFAQRKQAMEWLHGLATSGSGYGSSCMMWGVLRWLDYRRPLGQATDYDKLKRWLKRNWDELGGDGAIATLLDVALSEAWVRGSHREPFKLLNAVTNQVERFATVSWGTVTGKYSSSANYGYPDDWPRPWEGAHVDAPVQE